MIHYVFHLHFYFLIRLTFLLHILLPGKIHYVGVFIKKSSFYYFLNNEKFVFITYLNVQSVC